MRELDYSLYYENLEFDVPDQEQDYSIVDNEGMFDVFQPGAAANHYATWVEIRTDRTITVKLNLDSNDEITIASTDIPYVIAGVKIMDVLVKNASGATANIKMRFQDNPYA